MTFRAYRIVENADWRAGTPAVIEDLTAKVLAMPRDTGLRISKAAGGKMTAETAKKPERIQPCAAAKHKRRRHVR